MPAALAALQASMTEFATSNALDTHGPASRSPRSVEPSDVDSRHEWALPARHTAPIPFSVRNGDDYREIARLRNLPESSAGYRALHQEAIEMATLEAIGGMPCMEAARMYHLHDGAPGLNRLTLHVALYQGHDQVRKGAQPDAVAEALGIPFGSRGHQALCHAHAALHGDAAPTPTNVRTDAPSASVSGPHAAPLRPAPTPAPVALPLPDLVSSAQARNNRPAAPATAHPGPVDRFPYYLLPRTPHPYRSPGGEAGLTAMCEKVARGGDYRQIAAECGYTAGNTDFNPVCTEFEALHAQAKASATAAIRAGASVPEAATHYHLFDEVDLGSLAMLAAREIGEPLVRNGESFWRVRDRLGISAYEMAVQVLVDAS